MPFQPGVKYRLKHGHTNALGRSPTYWSWTAMRMRCLNPKYHAFHLYGGRGVKVCDRWLFSFVYFVADMGERPAGLTIDRWPNKDGDYEPGNCRWATKSEQALNRNHKQRKSPVIDT